jgi:hypothetical protein
MNKVDVLEAESRLVNVGRDIQKLLEDERMIFLLERIDQKVEATKREVIESPDWETLLERRGVLKGLSALRHEIDMIVSKGKTAESRLKIK